MFASFSDLLARVGALELTLLLLIGFCIGAGFVCALVFAAGFFWPKPAPSVYVQNVTALCAAGAKGHPAAAHRRRRGQRQRGRVRQQQP